jgi:hypothetical protein
MKTAIPLTAKRDPLYCKVAGTWTVSAGQYKSRAAVRRGARDFGHRSTRCGWSGPGPLVRPGASTSERSSQRRRRSTLPHREMPRGARILAITRVCVQQILNRALPLRTSSLASACSEPVLAPASVPATASLLQQAKAAVDISGLDLRGRHLPVLRRRRWTRDHGVPVQQRRDVQLRPDRRRVHRIPRSGGRLHGGRWDILSERLHRRRRQWDDSRAPFALRGQYRLCLRSDGARPDL